ncbi:B-cell receptor CD22-like [Palaemon carinicauda]|uniref:B-cell receptor CD22-like n=1 Tax=Palaemon carinicauda TaxID=392227 RepID=UPI0035B5B4C3
MAEVLGGAEYGNTVRSKVMTGCISSEQGVPGILCPTQSLGPDSTVSLLRLLTTPGDDGGILECRASSPTLPHLTASDSTELTVYYVPKATISIDAGSSSSLDSGLPSSGLREGSSATLTCVTRANPPVYNLTFMFNGRPLHRQNVITKGRSLTLLELQHQDSGLYTCLASNTEGDGESNAVALHIDCEYERIMF